MDGKCVINVHNYHLPPCWAGGYQDRVWSGMDKDWWGVYPGLRSDWRPRRENVQISAGLVSEQLTDPALGVPG
jgi:hypothetical protein